MADIGIEIDDTVLAFQHIVRACDRNVTGQCDNAGLDIVDPGRAAGDFSGRSNDNMILRVDAVDVRGFT